MKKGVGSVSMGVKGERGGCKGSGPVRGRCKAEWVRVQKGGFRLSLYTLLAPIMLPLTPARVKRSIREWCGCQGSGAGVKQNGACAKGSGAGVKGSITGVRTSKGSEAGVKGLERKK